MLIVVGIAAVLRAEFRLRHIRARVCSDLASHLDNDTIMLDSGPSVGTEKSNERSGDFVWKVDLHSHTIYSKDCLTPPAKLIAQARGRGLDKIAVTEHNNVAGARAAKELAPDLVIVGEEIMTTHGEIIAYFVREEVPRGLRPEEAIARLRDQDAVISIPHPLDSLRGSAMGRENVMAILHLVDALEVRNARCVRHADNAAAAELAAAEGKLVTAGSDAHTLYEVGRCYVELPPFEDTAASFKAALAQARPGGVESPFWPHLASTYAKAHKRLFGATS